MLYNIDGVRVPLTPKGVLSETISKGGMPKWAAREAADWAVRHWDALSKLPPEARAEAIRNSPWDDTRRKLDDELRALAGEFWATGALPDPDALDEELGPLWGSLLSWCQGRDFRPIVWDRICWDPHPDRRTADRVHLVAELDGVHWLVMIKARHGPYPEDRLKLAAWRYAPSLLTQDGMAADTWPRIDRCGILHVRPFGTVLLPQQVGPRERAAFRVAYRLARWLRSKPPK
jgi:hypothetical protein